MGPAVVTQAAAVRVWMVEDNAAYRNSLARVVEKLVGKEQAREFADCESALAALENSPMPDVMLLDLGLPGMSGLEGLRQLKKCAPQIRTIVLTSFEDRASIFEAISAGAAGYLLKNSKVSEITGAIRELMAGGAPMSRQVASVVLTMFAEIAAAKQSRKRFCLSPREHETLEGMVAGWTTKEIAARMSVSYHTVDTYIRSIYEKLDVQSRSGAVARAVREGLF
jgi:DNA-binding NarL/FixJ family response regulator